MKKGTSLSRAILFGRALCVALFWLSSNPATAATQGCGRVSAPDIATMSAEQRKVYDASVARLGGPYGPRMPMLQSPEVTQKWAELLSALERTAIPKRLWELGILVAAREWRSDFEWWAHATLAREAGISQGAIDAIRTGKQPHFDDDQEEAVYQFTTRLMKRRGVTDGQYERARAVLGDRVLVEYTVLLGYYEAVALIIEAHAVTLPPGVMPQLSTNRKGCGPVPGKPSR